MIDNKAHRNVTPFSFSLKYGGKGGKIRMQVAYLPAYRGLRNRVSSNIKHMEKNKEIRKLTRIGKRSIGLTLPIELVRDLGWRERQRVVVKRIKGGLVVRDYRSKR